ncbi:glycoside hydrolase superfamily [Aspergillus similis]
MRWACGLASALAGFLVYQSALASTADVDAADVSASAAVLAGNFTSPVSHAARSRCPVSCSESGLNSTAWSVYHRVERLDLCESPMLLDFNLFNKLDDPRAHLSIAACTADFSLSSSAKRESTTDASCLSDAVSRSTVTSYVQLASSGTTSSTKTTDVTNLLEQLQYAFTVSESTCKEKIHIGYTDKAAIGVYLGSALSSQGVISPVLDKLATQVQTDGSIAQETIVQLCDDSSARYLLGVYVSANADLPSVQQALQTWRNSSCITTEESTPKWYSISYMVPSSRQNSTRTINSTRLAARDEECTTIQVASGDTCDTLAAECGVPTAEFIEYNSQLDSSCDVVAGQHVCCTDGDLPDYTPSADSDGNCYSYTVQTGDTCSALAAAYDITADDIETWNTGSNGTWGWMGCNDLLVGSYICLSDGWPPMPANVPNAVCGPQVNNTAAAPHGTDLSTLNECPLNACCDIWGQCGITADFCTPSNSTTGNPGTAAKGENGCISNCGTEIILSDAPADTYSIAYFEASDQNRSCLSMSVDQVDTSVYTHIHFAFATINSDMSISVDGMEDQLSLLSDMTGVKRILSIGGWDFSTDTDTYMIFRDAVTSANRATLVSNIVDFLDEYDLDGVDFDWEYPDEPDIPGIPAGTTADSTNYYLTLVAMKEALSSDKTVSVTAPASFWYLERFPIEAIGSIVDYIVYMTYDLHGQWDYGNAFADSGCNDGNCLRSHVNMTETLSSLSMITKAGVSSNKIAVGVASYARSFEMAESGCWTAMCTYTGPDSGAWPGPCTDTAGYIANYELELVLAENPTAESHWDEDSYSNILVFNETQWAGYMNETNKAVRVALYEELGFLGSADWAVDLHRQLPPIPMGQHRGRNPDDQLGDGAINDSFPDQFLPVGGPRLRDPNHHLQPGQQL